MMANLQAVVRAHLSSGATIAQRPKGVLIEAINRELTAASATIGTQLCFGRNTMPTGLY